jgi:RAB protein geranylgeranyltransferase component A
MKFFPDYYDEYLNQKVISKEVEFIEKLLQNNRHYCLEISPKIVYCKGSLIELIANSGVGPSLEFQMPNALYLFRNGELEKVPGSKEDIFSNNDISLIDKRKIMKFFTFVLDFNPSCDENQHFKSLSFAEYLKSLKIPEKLIQTIIVSITFVIEQDMYQTLSAFDGILKCQLYLKSIGIYGNGAFLTALYGTGSELCQAFSRYSAVFGGCYILDCDVKSIQLSNDTITIESAEHIFESSKLIINRNYCQLLSSQPLIVTNRTFRLICISDTPFVSDGKHSIILSPPNQLDHTNGVHMIHYCGDNYVCPQGSCKVLIKHRYSSFDSSIRYEPLTIDCETVCKRPIPRNCVCT